jgi:hypothetical protein
MDKTFWLAGLAAFAVSFVLSFFFHGVVLYQDYMALAAVYRGPEGAIMPLLVLAQLIMAFAMVAIYRYGRENKPYLAQGARFGLLVAAASVIPAYMIGYAVTNIPATLAVKQIVFDTISVTAMGVVTAWFHRV